MKEINVRDLHAVVDPRRSEKQTHKPQPGGAGFSETLESVVTQMNQVGQREAVGAGKVDTSSIQEEVTAAQEEFAKLMQVERNLRELHQMLTRKSEDRS